MNDALTALAWVAALIYAIGCLIACAVLWEDVVDAYNDWANVSDYENLRRQMARTFLARLLAAPLIVVLWPLVALSAGVYLVSRAVREAI